MLLARSTANLSPSEAPLTSKSALQRAKQWRVDNGLEKIDPKLVDAEYQRLSTRATELAAGVTIQNEALIAEAQAAPTRDEGGVVAAVAENAPEPTPDPTLATTVTEGPVADVLDETDGTPVSLFEPPPAPTPDPDLATTVTEGLVADVPFDAPAPMIAIPPNSVAESIVSPDRAAAPVDGSRVDENRKKPSAPELLKRVTDRMRSFCAIPRHTARPLLALGLVCLGILEGYAQMHRTNVPNVPDQGLGKQPIALVVPDQVNRGPQNFVYTPPMSAWEEVTRSPAQPEVSATGGDGHVDTEPASRNTVPPPVQPEKDMKPIRQPQQRPDQSKNDRQVQVDTTAAIDNGLSAVLQGQWPHEGKLSLPESYVPQDLIEISAHDIKATLWNGTKNHLISEKAFPALKSFLDACSQAGYPNLMLAHTYRSYEEQKGIHSQNPNGAALEGKSQHQTGMAFDLYLLNSDGSLAPINQEIINIAKKHGIVHPLPRDTPHFFVLEALNQGIMNQVLKSDDPNKTINELVMLRVGEIGNGSLSQVSSHESQTTVDKSTQEIVSTWESHGFVVEKKLGGEIIITTPAPTKNSLWYGGTLGGRYFKGDWYAGKEANAAQAMQDIRTYLPKELKPGDEFALIKDRLLRLEGSGYIQTPLGEGSGACWAAHNFISAQDAFNARAPIKILIPIGPRPTHNPHIYPTYIPDDERVPGLEGAKAFTGGYTIYQISPGVAGADQKFQVNKELEKAFPGYKVTVTTELVFHMGTGKEDPSYASTQYTLHLKPNNVEIAASVTDQDKHVDPLSEVSGTQAPDKKIAYVHSLSAKDLPYEQRSPGKFADVEHTEDGRIRAGDDNYNDLSPLDLIFVSETNRSPNALVAAVQHLNVADTENLRYQPTEKDGQTRTFCNIFLADIMRQMFPYHPEVVPTHWREVDEPQQDGSIRRVQKEMRANDYARWFRSGEARSLGWLMITESEARAYADRGIPVAVTMESIQGDVPGHVMIGVPSPKNAEKRGLYIAQAGAENFESRLFKPSAYENLRDIKYTKPEYYVNKVDLPQTASVTDVGDNIEWSNLATVSYTALDRPALDRKIAERQSRVARQQGRQYGNNMS